MLCRLLFILMMQFSLLLFSLGSAETYILQRFGGIYEPSGVVQLSNGEIVIIEDNPDSPLWLMEPRQESERLVLQVKREIALQTSYDDLEGIAVGKNDLLFLITSHSVLKDGRRIKKREKLLKVDLGKSIPMEEVSTTEILPTLTPILSNLPGMDQLNLQLNIEALSFDQTKERLLIGFRSPMVESRSIVVEFINPYEAASKTVPPAVSDYVFELEMQGGIRALCFDHLSKRFILANEIESGGKKITALWHWSGGMAAPEMLNIPGVQGLKNVEGISVISWKNKEYLLLVCDNGKKKKNKGAHYLIVDYKDLQ